jgi:hypothetical protein
MTARASQVEQQIKELVGGFAHFLTVFDEHPRAPFRHPDQLAWHLKTTELRTRLQTGERAAADPEFSTSLYRTLQAWGLDQRGSKLVPPTAFFQELAFRGKDVGRFDGLCIDDPKLPMHQVASELWSLINALHIVENKAKMVAGSKALHHLLPDLIVPIDRAWTRRFFRYYRPQFQGQYGSQKPVFIDVFTTFLRIARALPLMSYVGTEGRPWRTSRTKVIDNALVGYCVSKNLPLPD